MSDGYLAIIFFWFFVLFWLMGFFDHWLKEHRISNTLLASGIIFVILCQLFQFEIFQRITINLGGFLIPFFLSFLIWIKSLDRNRLNVLTQSLLVAATISLLREMFILDPILMFMDPLYILALASVGLSLNLLRKPDEFFTVLTMGLCLQEIWYQVSLLHFLPQAVLGEDYFQDILWTSYMLGFFMHCLLKFQLRFLPVGRKIYSKRKTIEWKNIR